MKTLTPFLLYLWISLASHADSSPYFKIHVVDDQTERGVPLVVLTTVNGIEYVTDSNGLIAFFEPGLMETDVHFSVFSHGYTPPKDGFDIAGVRLHTETGGSAVIRLKRNNIAQRLYRITGQGIYRDSVLLNEPVPTRHPLLNGKVMGQDSTLAALYNGRIYWFWGDTARPSYPLGNFKTTGAVSDLPIHGGLSPEMGIDLQYFTNPEGFVKPMCPWVQNGLIWIDGVLTLKDSDGNERLLTHYSHLENMETLLEHGIAAFDDETEEFVKIKAFDKNKIWQAPRYHPIPVTEADGETFFYFPDWFSLVRVKAEYTSLLDPSQYEAFTCIQSGHSFKGKQTPIETQNGKPVYAWKKNTEPISSKQEHELVKAGILQDSATHFLPKDVETEQPVVIHRGSIRRNAYRNKWILIGGQLGGSSMLGEIWYAEANHPTGPWRWAQKIVTHQNYSFYNPVHHPFFDREGGRIIFFEGTYTKTFSGSTHPTPRYDYNQILYQLNLDHVSKEP